MSTTTCLCGEMRKNISMKTYIMGNEKHLVEALLMSATTYVLVEK